MTGSRHIPFRTATLVVAGLCIAGVGVGAGLALSEPLAARSPGGPSARRPAMARSAAATPTRSRGRTAAGGRARRGRVRRSEISLTAVDPGYAYGIQVGDTVTLTATVHDPNVTRPLGLVSFHSDDAYDHCPAVPLRRATTARCYLTFYAPGPFHVTAQYVGHDRSAATVTLHFTVVPATND